MSINEASKTRTLDIAFVVDAEHLRRLAVILTETSDKLEYTVTYSDGTNVHYGDIEDIIGQSNSNERSIVSLIAGTADERFKSAFVNLKKDGSPSLEYTVHGSQRDVIYCANQLDDWVASVRQWYSLFISSKNGSPASLALGVACIILPIYAWDWISRLYSGFGKDGSYQWIALPALILMGVAEYYILRLFPRGIFAVGHGMKRCQFNIYVRTTVIAGLVLSVIAGVIANWIRTVGRFICGQQKLGPKFSFQSKITSWMTSRHCPTRIRFGRARVRQRIAVQFGRKRIENCSRKLESRAIHTGSGIHSPRTCCLVKCPSKQ